MPYVFLDVGTQILNINEFFTRRIPIPIHHLEISLSYVVVEFKCCVDVFRNSAEGRAYILLSPQAKFPEVTAAVVL
jgi:hypothetical protein